MEIKPTWFDRAVAALSPSWGLRRMQAKTALTLYGFDGARYGHERGMARRLESPTNSRYERDRTTIMWEARDLEDNFPLVACINRKYATHVAPQDYQAETGDKVLDAEVEQYLDECFFNVADARGVYTFWELAQFAVWGTKRDGDHGWLLARPGLDPLMRPEDVAKLPVRVQAFEADLIGNSMSNVVREDYTGGVTVGEDGRPTAYDLYRRGISNSLYEPLIIGLPAHNFVHFMDATRVAYYRGVSTLASAVTTLRDLKETLDALRIGVKKHATITSVITGSVGAEPGPGEFDPFADAPAGGRSRFYESTAPGKNLYLNAGEDVKFPEGHTPSGENQYLVEFLVKLVATAYNLPVSYAVDASAIGGVSVRLESQQALTEFKRSRRVFSARFDRAKNAALVQAGGLTGPFRGRGLELFRGSWVYPEHPTPDLGREAQALAILLEHNVLDPMSVITESGRQPERVAGAFAKWARLKNEAAAACGVTVAEAFTPSKPSEVADVEKAEADKVAALKPAPQVPPGGGAPGRNKFNCGTGDGGFQPGNSCGGGEGGGGDDGGGSDDFDEDDTSTYPDAVTAEERAAVDESAELNDNWDDDDPTTWGETEAEGTRLAAVREEVEEFDEYDPSTWGREIVPDERVAGEAEELATEVEGYDADDPSTWGGELSPQKIGDSTYQSTRGEILSDAVEAWDESDPDTWGLEGAEADEVEALKEDFDGQSEDDPDSWVGARDPQLAAVGQQYAAAEEGSPEEAEAQRRGAAIIAANDARLEERGQQARRDLKAKFKAEKEAATQRHKDGKRRLGEMRERAKAAAKERQRELAAKLKAAIKRSEELEKRAELAKRKARQASRG